MIFLLLFRLIVIVRIGLLQPFDEIIAYISKELAFIF